MGILERAERYIERGPDDSSCWIWVGATSGKASTPCLKVDGKSQYVARLLYEAEHGSIGRLRLRTLCGVDACVRPSHHEPIPLRRGYNHNRRKDAAGMLLCPEGHRPLPTWADVETIQKTQCHGCRRMLAGLRKQMLKIIHGGTHGSQVHA